MAFQEVIVWASFVVLAWSDVAHLVDPASRSFRSIRCDGYFGHLYPCGTHLLIASATELICVDKKGEEVWRRRGLGIDGVIVEHVVDGRIEGQGEWDPPGGWQPFCLTFDTGEPAAS